MTGPLLAGAAVFGLGFLAAVRRHDRDPSTADRLVPPFRQLAVEGLLLSLAGGLGLGGLASLLFGVNP